MRGWCTRRRWWIRAKGVGGRMWMLVRRCFGRWLLGGMGGWGGWSGSGFRGLCEGRGRWCARFYFSYRRWCRRRWRWWESGKKITNKPHWIALHVDDIPPPSLHHPYPLSLRFRIGKALPGHGLHCIHYLYTFLRYQPYPVLL